MSMETSVRRLNSFTCIGDKLRKRGLTGVQLLVSTADCANASISAESGTLAASEGYRLPNSELHHLIQVQ